MATECYHGIVRLLHNTTNLDLPSVKCAADQGICFSSLTHGVGQAIVQLGCWPLHITKQVAWLGVPECKKEFGNVVCLCLEPLCNGFIPSHSDRSPEGGALQGGIIGALMVMLVVVLLGVATWMVLKLVKRPTTCSEKMEDVEDVQDDSFRSSTSVCNIPHPPAPLMKTCSAPASLQSKRPKQLKLE